MPSRERSSKEFEGQEKVRTLSIKTDTSNEFLSPFLEQIRQNKNGLNLKKVLDALSYEQLHQIYLTLCVKENALKDFFSKEEYKLFLKALEPESDGLQKSKANLRERLGVLFSSIWGPLTGTLGTISPIIQCALSVPTLNIVGIIVNLIIALFNLISGLKNFKNLRADSEQIIDETANQHLKYLVLRSANKLKFDKTQELTGEIKDLFDKNFNLFLELIPKERYPDLSLKCEELVAIFNSPEKISELDERKKISDRLTTLTDLFTKIKSSGILSPNNLDKLTQIINTECAGQSAANLSQISGFSFLQADSLTSNIEEPGPFTLRTWLKQPDTKKQILKQLISSGLGALGGSLMPILGFFGIITVASFVPPLILGVVLLATSLLLLSSFYTLYRDGKRKHELEHYKKNLIPPQDKLRQDLDVSYTNMKGLKEDLEKIHSQLNTTQMMTTVEAENQKKSMAKAKEKIDKLKNLIEKQRTRKERIQKEIFEIQPDFIADSKQTTSLELQSENVLIESLEKGLNELKEQTNTLKEKLLQLRAVQLAQKDKQIALLKEDLHAALLKNQAMQGTDTSSSTKGVEISSSPYLFFANPEAKLKEAAQSSPMSKRNNEELYKDGSTSSNDSFSGSRTPKTPRRHGHHDIAYSH